MGDDGVAHLAHHSLRQMLTCSTFLPDEDQSLRNTQRTRGQSRVMSTYPNFLTLMFQLLVPGLDRECILLLLLAALGATNDMLFKSLIFDLSPFQFWVVLSYPLSKSSICWLSTSRHAPLTLRGCSLCPHEVLLVL